MKPFVVFGLFFSFAIMPVFSADNSPPSKTSASPSAAPAPKKSVVVTRPQKSVGHPVIVAGKPRLNPDLNARRYYPAGFQSAPKPPLALNASKTPQSYRPGQRSPAPVIASPSNANGSKSSNAA